METRGDSRRVIEASLAPILSCLVPEQLFERGIGHVVLARSLRAGSVDAAFFLVDTWCIGVKDAFFRVAPQYKFEERIDSLRGGQELAETGPSIARKLLQEAAFYAASLKLAPSPDYYNVALLFGDVPMASETFTFGKDGKPFYVSGPNDSRARIREIMNALQRSVADGNFEFMANIGGFG